MLYNPLAFMIPLNNSSNISECYQQIQNEEILWKVWRLNLIFLQLTSLGAQIFFFFSNLKNMGILIWHLSLVRVAMHYQYFQYCSGIYWKTAKTQMHCSVQKEPSPSGYHAFQEYRSCNKRCLTNITLSIYL